MTPSELSSRLADGAKMLLVDVRPASAYEAGHIPGAINIPLNLLRVKRLPPASSIVVYGDGLGQLSDDEALAAVAGKSNASVDVLRGGYAAWLTDERTSTARPGFAPEKLPGITYDRLLTTAHDDIVLVDLRAPPALAASSGPSKETRAAAAARAPDLVQGFAQKLGVPLVRGAGATIGSPIKSAGTAAMAAAAPAAAPSTDSSKLLVLVADNAAVADETARRLRASGNHRVTILIGGTEAIRFEGRRGSGRTGGDLPVISDPR